jgi:hypothetical protein
MISYLATPYTHYALGTEAAFIEASRIAGQLAEQGIIVFSPIAHSHPLAAYGGLDSLDGKFWKTFDAPFICVCDCLIIAMMDGWRASEGVTHEIAEFRKAGKPILYLDPQTMAFVEPMEKVA